jgi:hypothetical protein
MKVMDTKPFNTDMIIPKDIVVSLEHMLSYQNYKLMRLINKDNK